MNNQQTIDPINSGIYLEPRTKEPDMEKLQEWLSDTLCEATDGCTVEHDGVCEHGHPSWFLHFGLI